MEDLEWAFDGKYPTILKNDILAVLKSTNGKAALNNSLIIDKFNDYAGRVGYSNNIINIDDLLLFLENNND